MTVDGFGNQFIDLKPPCLLHVFFLSMSSARYDQRLSHHVLTIKLPNRNSRLKPIHDWHAAIHEDQTEGHAFLILLLHNLEGLQAVEDAIDVSVESLVAELADCELEAEHVIWFVVNDEDFDLSLTGRDAFVERSIDSS